MTATQTLSIHDLNVWIDRPRGAALHIVRDLNFSVRNGERVGLVGESGCGKTTTIMAIMGLLPPTARVSGHIRLDGEDVLAGGETTIRPRRLVDIAMIFQAAMSSLNPVMTVGRQIADPLRRRLGYNRSQADARVLELLDAVDLSPDIRNMHPHELSGGMRQRVVIAKGLSCNPRFLLADEPTTSLDALVQRQITELLTRLSADFNLGVLLVSHDLAMVADFCTRAMVMYAGRIIETGPPAMLTSDAKHPYTRKLAAATPILGHGGKLETIPGAQPSPADHADGCAFMPRCDRAVSICRSERPREVRTGADIVACHAVTVGAADDK
ncbi:MAG TPA: ABC transporter ATP-binding protein [Mycobacteriales bacterium]|nr:ABC transporter ATP-binding protein [Mycobacteriales bacterium]